jgi:short-subunit dehydrogenase
MSTKQSAIIVGAGPRLSFALARKFGEGLGEVALISRTGDRLATLVEELNGLGVAGHGFVADAADLNALGAAIRKATAAMSPLKVLIYNAAIVRPCRPLELDPANLVNELIVDAVAPLAAAQIVTPVLEANGGGSVLFTAERRQSRTAQSHCHVGARPRAQGHSDSRGHNLRLPG